MRKGSYASGFLYHPKTQQILLQQDNSTDDDNDEWKLFCGENKNKEDIKEAFLRIINLRLNLRLKPNSIYSVYDYEYKHKNIYIFYANVTKLEKIYNKTKIFSWFTFKQVQKLPLSEQVRQDITVGKRVIDSSIRKRMGIRTIG